MAPHDEKPDATQPTEPAAPVTRLSKQQARFRQWQGQAKRAATSKGGVGNPKRRQPSLPPTPWDNEK